MAKINVAKAFVFTHPDHKKQHFAAGVHKDVPQEVADHWFVRAHLHLDEEQPEGGKKPQPEGGKK